MWGGGGFVCVLVEETAHYKHELYYNYFPFRGHDLNKWLVLNLLCL